MRSARLQAWLLGIIFAVAFAAAPRVDAQTEKPHAEAWSREKVAQARNEGKTVFVSFRADWCVTCKLNELLVFPSPRVQAALGAANVKYLIADWTSKNNPAIRDELTYYGQEGVPVYLVFGPVERRPKMLPKVLSKRDVIDALKSDAKK